MKHLDKFILSFGFILLICLAIFSNSCKKDTTTGGGPATPVKDSVPTTDANALQNAITITNGVLTAGALPVASTDPAAPTISNFQPSSSTSAGYQLLLPFDYTAATNWKHIYLQVVGATNGYFNITNTSKLTGVFAIPINIPGHIKNGTFSIIFSVVDNNGLVSSYVTTIIVIKNALGCTNASNSGSEGLTFTQVDLGNTAGTASLYYDTYTVPDRVDLFQGTTWLGGTGTNPGTTIPPLCNCSTPLPGFIGASGTITFNYNPANGRIVTVVVSGCLGGGTAWVWNLTCPQ